MHVRDLSRRENREIPWSPACGNGRAGRAGKAKGRNPVMDDRGKSDDLVVPAKRPNNAHGGAAEAVEGRGSPRGTQPAKHAPDTVPDVACQ